MNDHIPDNAICALSQLFCHGISLIDNEILVEDLKDLTPLKTVRHTHDVAWSPEQISMKSKYGEGIASSERCKMLLCKVILRSAGMLIVDKRNGGQYPVPGQQEAGKNAASVWEIIGASK